jgi:lactoylglutathione lyase
MQIEHVAIWTRDPERLRSFYETYFDAVAGPRYENPRKQFTSYFLSFRSGARLEIMSVPALRDDHDGVQPPAVGYAHLAITVGDEPGVDSLTERLRADGYRVLDGPRRTGDGYYESVIADPDGNRIEITA